MRGRPPKKSMTAEQERAAAAFVEAAETPPDPVARTPMPATPVEELPPAAESRQPRTPRRQRAATPRRSSARSRRPTASEYPWEDLRVRDDVMKGYPLRLPEPLYLQLKFAAQQAGMSMNEFCNEAVAAAVANQLTALGVPATRR